MFEIKPGNIVRLVSREAKQQIASKTKKKTLLCSGENTGRWGGGVCDHPPNLKNSRFRRAIEDFAGRQEELYCHTETPPLKFVKGRLRILKWKYYICYKPPFLTLHFRERNRYVRKSSVICKAKACLTESHSQWMQ